ncbi:MAG: transcriptional regulator [Alphaproteobacteria bacterium]|nr:MAG: transcriptional regulator [Alphaproteobacteria bacterium]
MEFALVQHLVAKRLRQSASVKSAVRVLQVFELFSEVRRPVALKEIVRILEYPQSSATVLLKSLLHAGYLNYDRKERTYFPTPKLYALGQWLNDIINSDLNAALHRIREETGETVILAVQNDLYIQYLEVLDSSHEMRFHVRKGSLIPITETSLGWVLLADKPDTEVDAICRQINNRVPAGGDRIDIADFLQRLETACRQQYCYVRNMPMRGGGCVSMRLETKLGGRAAAIGTGGLCERLDENLAAIVDSMRRNISPWVAPR